MGKNVFLYVSMLFAGVILVSACVFIATSRYVEVEYIGNGEIAKAVNTLVSRMIVLFTGQSGC